MNVTRLVGLAASWALLLFVGARLVPAMHYLVDLRSAAFVVFLPWVVVVAAHGPGVAARALIDALSSASAELPPDRRADGVAVLTSLGGLSFAAGIIGLLGTFATIQSFAASSGPLESGHLVLATGAMILAPIYGLLLRAFFYDPLAVGLEGPASTLGATLERE
jgi:hypothetical protein